ncbi:sugar-transfer associated ATP-grasp domain-containing protein [Salipaludibacillus aurantiacus]|uniref:Capsule synthesis protein PGA_cap n=1 Tax=Salipaludibacillus aurantiacus TaxID=1601833 RepID=A0A1H9VGH4_9BACI|nr:sugar-transfer associated ATP-grasp domain-containing protein [Salipaludibacillus aurantiacus]SES20383.1 capsule synthesis protein PGA_cap [Salipaludibacillus aurantiacus]
MKKFNVTFAGDTSLGDNHLKKRGRESALERLETNPLSFFKKMMPLVKQSDYLIVNLETDLDEKTGKEENINVVGEKASRTIDVFNKIGVSAVNMANDQMAESDSLLKTKDQLAKAGITGFGGGENIEEALKPLTIELKGESGLKKVYVFSGMQTSGRTNQPGYFANNESPGISSLDEVNSRIETLRNEEPDALIIVFPHWQGMNYKWVADLARYQKTCRNLLASGADYVFGHGTHTANPIEKNENGTIVYSLGNFVFNSNGRYNSARAIPYSLIVNLEITENEGKWEVEEKYYPIVTDNKRTKFNSRPVKKQEAAKLKTELIAKLPLEHGQYAYVRYNDDFGYFYKLNPTKNVLRRFGTDIKGNGYKKYKEAGLLKTIDQPFVEEVQTFWNTNYGKNVDATIHAVFNNLTGRQDPRVVPFKTMRQELIPYFNKVGKRNMYSDKNLYDKLISTDQAAKTIIKRVRGNYFSEHNDYLSPDDAWRELYRKGMDFIIKPTVTNNGVGISKVVFKDNKFFIKDKEISLEDLENDYGPNFVAQEVITQHPVMGEPHPNSVNSLRMVTLRWKGEIKYLLTFARFGAHGSVKDNAGSGGVCCGVADDGTFLPVAMDEKANTYTHHPSTNYEFAQGAKVPNFEECKSFVKELHKDILHHDYISWDVAIGEDGKPIFVELNFTGVTWLYQLAAQKPLFGDLTEEVLQHVSAELKKNRSPRDYRPANYGG